jgi:hypothetical protein
MKKNKTENDTIKKNIDQDYLAITETVVCKYEGRFNKMAR